MSFEERLRAIAGTLGSAQRRAQTAEEQARMAVAFHGPYVLRRFADIAAAFDAPALHVGQGGIFARRDVYGYHTVEFAASDLHIVLDHDDGQAHLSWLAGDATDNWTVTTDTPTAEIDAMLLAAITAFVKARGAADPASDDGVAMKEAQHV
jgi:hypothetical protein